MDCTAGSKKTYGKNPCSGVPPPDAPGLASGVAGGVRPGLVNRRINGQKRNTGVIVDAFNRDVKLHRPGPLGAHGGGGPRGSIVMLSPAARRRMLHTFRNAEVLPVMLTLTYPRAFTKDGREVKRHWSCMRKWLVRQGRRGLWFLEFQERGAPHVQMYLDGQVPYDAVARRWYEIVASGDLRHLAAGTRIEMLEKPHAMAAYAAKYATKNEQKEVPEGFEAVGRFWGSFGDVAVEALATVAASESLVCETTTGELLPNLVVQAVRVARHVVNARRRAAGYPPIRDNGRYGRTFYDAGPAIAEYLRRVNTNV